MTNQMRYQAVLSYGYEIYCVTIQRKATEQYFLVVLSIRVYKVVATFDSVENRQSRTAFGYWCNKRNDNQYLELVFLCHYISCNLCKMGYSGKKFNPDE